MEAVILAGGFGTRLASVVSDVPKPMAAVAGKPFLSFLLDDLVQQGITRIVLAVCYKKEIIMERFGATYRGMEIVYSTEDKPLDTGGAIRKALSFCREERVFVLNGDSFLAVRLKELRRMAEAYDREIVIVVKPMTDFSRYGTVERDRAGAVVAFHEKQYCRKGYINGGIYDIRRTALERYPQKFNMERDCFPELLKAQEIWSMESDGYFIDIGIPEDYVRIQEESECLRS